MFLSFVRTNLIFDLIQKGWQGPRIMKASITARIALALFFHPEHVVQFYRYSSYQRFFICHAWLSCAGADLPRWQRICSFYLCSVSNDRERNRDRWNNYSKEPNRLWKPRSLRERSWIISRTSTAGVHQMRLLHRHSLYHWLQLVIIKWLDFKLCNFFPFFLNFSWRFFLFPDWKLI